MDRRERYSDLEEGLRIALEGQQSKLWTALPGIVVAFDPVRQTCNVQPALAVDVRQQDGTLKQLNLPILLDCPIQFASGGGVTLTFPIAVNDEVLVVFASRCIDSWWAQGGNITQGGLQPVQPELRMHDLSDGFVLPGIRSQPNKFTISTTAAQLRTNDGLAYLELDPTTHNMKVNTPADLTAIVGGNVLATVTGDITATAANVKATATATAEIEAPTITLTGNVKITGLLTLEAGLSVTGGAATLGAANLTTTGDISGTNVVASAGVSSGGKLFNTHTHPVTTAPGTTGTPT